MTKLARSRIAAALGLAALIAVSILVWRTGVFDGYSDVDAVAERMRSAGAAAPLACIGIQVVQVVFFPVPGGVVQFATGYVFGGGFGFLLSLAGIMLGSSLAFLVGSFAGRPLLERLVRPETIERVDRIVASERARLGLFIAYLIPGSPKDAFCYASGAARFSFGEFFVITALGRSPALLVTTVLGSQLSERDYVSIAWTIAAAAAATGLFWLYRRRFGA